MKYRVEVDKTVTLEITTEAESVEEAIREAERLAELPVYWLVQGTHIVARDAQEITP